MAKKVVVAGGNGFLGRPTTGLGVLPLLTVFQDLEYVE